MGRIADPWRWEERQGWYAWIKGKRIRLASFHEGVNRAKQRLRELLNEAEGPSDAPVLVGRLVADYLGHMLRRREQGDIAAQTKADAERRIAGFADLHGDTPADQVRPRHVEEWLATRTGWDATSRHDGVGAVKGIFRWAAREGRIDRDPLAAMAKPARKPKRERIPTAEEIERLFAAVLMPELRDLLTFLRETGCRPKEARTLEARHFERDAGRTVLREHKTAKKTGRPRVVYLSAGAEAIVARLAEANPEGPIFRNGRGRPWTKDHLVDVVADARRRAGLGPEVVAYGFRHGFATDALAGGANPALVAELMGHADLRMLSKYTHLSDKHDALREAVAKVRPGES